MVPAWAVPVSPSSGGSATLGDGDTIAGLTGQIAAAKSQLAGLDAKMTAASEAYDAGRIRLGQAQAAAADAQERVTRANRAVQAAEASRRGLAAAAYRAGGLDTLSAILTGSPGEALDRVGALDALARRADTAETQVRLARGDLTQAQVDARTQLAAAQSAFDTISTQQTIIETSAGAQQTLLDGLISKQADLEQQARERAAAAERARQQAAAAAAAKAAAQAAADQAQERQQSGLLRQATAAFAAAPKPAGSGSSAAAAGLPPLGSGGAPVAVAEAYKLLGKPYVWGADGPDSFDCSGLTEWAWARAGVRLPHYTSDQWNAGRHVTRDQLQPGDLVFFFSDVSHVGIYIGNGQMIHAPHSGTAVRVEDVWWDQFQGAVRPAG
jgi:cell wall-associated NlpC family hydrolase